MRENFKDFEEYYGWFLSDHRRSATRWRHFVGEQLGAVLGLVSLVGRQRRLMLPAVVLGTGLPVATHFLIERNRPRLYGRPGWAVSSDVQMIVAMWRGQNVELGRRAKAVYEERMRSREAARAGSYDRIDPAGNHCRR